MDALRRENGSGKIESTICEFFFQRRKSRAPFRVSHFAIKHQREWLLKTLLHDKSTL